MPSIYRLSIIVIIIPMIMNRIIKVFEWHSLDFDGMYESDCLWVKWTAWKMDEWMSEGVCVNGVIRADRIFLRVKPKSICRVVCCSKDLDKTYIIDCCRRCSWYAQNWLAWDQLNWSQREEIHKINNKSRFSDFISFRFAFHAARMFLFVFVALLQVVNFWLLLILALARRV